MPRYSFKVRDGSSTVEEHHSIKLPGYDEAYREALQFAATWLEVRGLKASQDYSWEAVVKDDDQREVVRIEIAVRVTPPVMLDP